MFTYIHMLFFVLEWSKLYIFWYLNSENILEKVPQLNCIIILYIEKLKKNVSQI